MTLPLRHATIQRLSQEYTEFVVFVNFIGNETGSKGNKQSNSDGNGIRRELKYELDYTHV